MEYFTAPDRKNDLLDIQQHLESVESVMSGLEQHDFAILFGDYNHPEMLWSPSEDGGFKIDSGRTSLSASSSALYDGFCFHGLTQVNSIKNAYDRILDLVLVNERTLPVCRLSQAVESLVVPDTAHPALEIGIRITTPVKFEHVLECRRFDFHRADYDVLSNELASIDWQFLDSVRSLNDMVDTFSNEVLRIIERHVPVQRPPLKPPWTNPYLRKLKKRSG